MSRRARLASWGLAAVLATLLTATLAGAEAWAAPSHTLSLRTIVNGQPAITSSDARPAQLFANRPVYLRLKVHNSGSSSVEVAAVRFEGQVLDLPLFSYDTTLDLRVRPGATVSVGLPISTNGIGNLATGLIVASVTLAGRNGGALASQSVVTEVHGSFHSIYGLFGLVVLVLTASSLLFALIAMVRHTLPENRFLRALRFFVPGFGVGLVLTFTTAAFGIFSPAPGHWLPLLVVPAAAGLALGFLTPAPDEEEFDDYDEDVLLAEIMVVDDTPGATGTGMLEQAGGPGAGPELVAAGRMTPAPSARMTAAPPGRATIVPPELLPPAPQSRPTALPDPPPPPQAPPPPPPPPPPPWSPPPSQAPPPPPPAPPPPSGAIVPAELLPPPPGSRPTVIPDPPPATWPPPPDVSEDPPPAAP